MIETMTFENEDGINIYTFNDDFTPMRHFAIDIEYRNDPVMRAAANGAFPAKTYQGLAFYRCEGDLFGDSSGDYNQRRLALRAALQPQSYLGSIPVGRLKMRFTGINEELYADCSIDGVPEMPIEALGPARSEWMITFKSSEPRMFSVVEYSADILGTVGIVGRTYNKTYNKTYTGFGGSGGQAFITNGGNVETPARVRFLGPCTSPSLTLNGPQGAQVITLEGIVLSSSEYADVNLDSNNRTAVKSTGENLYSSTIGSDWWQLAAGNNDVRYDAFSQSSPSKATVYWRNAYIF